MERRLHRKDRTVNRSLRIFGLTSSAPNIFNRLWWFKLVRALGVWPRGDQLRLSGDTKEKPLSSTSAKVAFNARHFFYPWPNTLIPVHNRFVVALDR